METVRKREMFWEREGNDLIEVWLEFMESKKRDLPCVPA